MLSAMVGGFDKDVLEEFYDLTPDQFARLLNLYSAEYGEGAEKKHGEISTRMPQKTSPILSQMQT